MGVPVPLVEVHGLCRAYGRGAARRTVLDGVSLQVTGGEFLAIVGESGCGKTTLLNIIAGLDSRYEGRVEVCGRDLAGLSDGAMSALRSRSLGFVFQSFNLLEHLTVLENVALPGVLRGGAAASRRGRALRCLEEVGLEGRGGDLASQLSGGQKQRAGIARALFNEPSLLLCDEPTGNLDSESGRQIIELFGRLHREQGLTLVVVTHEDRVSRVASRVLRMRDGRLAGEGA